MNINGLRTVFEYFVWQRFWFYLALSAVLCAFAAAVPHGKKRIPLRVSAAAVFTLLSAAALYVSYGLSTSYELVHPLICALFMILCAFVCGERKAYRAIALPLLAANVYTVANAVISNAAFYVHSSERNLWRYIFDANSTASYIILLSLLAAVLVLIFVFDRKNGIELEKRESVAVVSALIFSTVSIVLIGIVLRHNRLYVYEKVVSYDTMVQSIEYCVVILACAVIMCMSFYVMAFIIVRNRRRQAEQAMIAQKAAGQSELVEEFSKKDEAISKMRHDCANILGTVDGLLAAGKYEEAHEYIREHTGTLASDTVSVRTDNVYLNAIIGYKTAQAKDRGVDVSVYSVSTVEFPDNSDLCSLVGNMLDNAITAADECEDGGEVRLDICRDGDGYSISVLNSVPSPVMLANPRLETTKADRSAHGFGTRIIREIADKYYGSVDWYDTSDGKFCCRAVVYPEKPF